jgi:hypothetical protein
VLSDILAYRERERKRFVFGCLILVLKVPNYATREEASNSIRIV